MNTAVFHLKDDERKSALSMLLLLGLNHYAKATKTQTIDLNVLQRLHGKCVPVTYVVLCSVIEEVQIALLLIGSR